jgi:SAM-dependent methyltransferase
VIERAAVQRDLVAFYAGDAAEREHRGLQPHRHRLRRRFIEQLQREGCRKLLELGPGTGHDAAAFLEAGFEVTAVDLSPEHVARCREKGIDARVGDVYALDLPDAGFDAGWTMSTLLHIPNADLDGVLTEIARVLKPGGPIGLGLWGGVDREGVFEGDRAEPKRFFSLRADDTLRVSLERHFTVEAFEVTALDGEMHYQFCLVRV